MPGTIQVSVIDFKTMQSSSPSSQVSMKVSMGKIEHRISGKGDFSFPLTSLRDNVTITVEDAAGNEISHTVVETRLLVEKGLWDDILHLKGGGHIHMKLHFVLSEEERNKIRIVRESALKRKHDELCNSRHGSSEGVSVVHNVSSSLPVNPDVSDEKEGNLLATPLSQAVDVHQTDQDHRDLIKVETQSAPANSSFIGTIFSKPAISTKNIPVLPKDDEVNNSKLQPPIKKTHSNVRKMISAFEGSLAQDMKPHIKPPPIKFQSRKTEIGPPVGGSPINEVGASKTLSAQSTLGSISVPSQSEELQQTKTYVSKIGEQAGFGRPLYGAGSASYQDKKQLNLKWSTATHLQSGRTNLDLKSKLKIVHKEVSVKEDKKYSEDPKWSSTLERAAFSGRILDKQSENHRPLHFFSKKQISYKTLFARENGEGIHSKDPEGLQIQEVLNDKVYSGLWIFPDETKCLCITTSGKQVMDLMGGSCYEANAHKKTMYYCEPEYLGKSNVHGGTAVKVKAEEETSEELRKPKLENSADDEHPRGPLGQVVKIAIMVGFATLVLLTRQRKKG